MAIPDMVFLAAIGAGHLVFMSTLGWASWYCWDRAPQQAVRRASGRGSLAGPHRTDSASATRPGAVALAASLQKELRS